MRRVEKARGIEGYFFILIAVFLILLAGAESPLGAPAISKKNYNVAILLDISGSMKGKSRFEKAKEATLALVKALKSNDNLIFFTFDQKPHDKDKGIVHRHDKPGELDRIVEEAIGDIGKGKGTEKSWAIARAMMQLDKFLQDPKNKNYMEYENLIVIITDRDDDVQGFKETAPEDFSYFDKAMTEKRLVEIATESDPSELVVSFYQYKKGEKYEETIGDGKPSTDITEKTLDIWKEIQGTGATAPEDDEAEKKDLENKGLVINALTKGTLAPEKEPKGKFIGKFTLLSEYETLYFKGDIGVRVSIKDEKGKAVPQNEFDWKVVYTKDTEKFTGKELKDVSLGPVATSDEGAPLQEQIPFEITVETKLKKPAFQIKDKTFSGTIQFEVKDGKLAKAKFVGDYEATFAARDIKIHNYEKVIPPRSFSFATRGNPLPLILLALAGVIFLIIIIAVISKARQADVERSKPLSIWMKNRDRDDFQEFKMTPGGSKSFGNSQVDLPFADPAFELVRERDSFFLQAKPSFSLVDASGAEQNKLAISRPGAVEIRKSGSEEKGEIEFSPYKPTVSTDAEYGENIEDPYSEA